MTHYLEAQFAAASAEVEATRSRAAALAGDVTKPCDASTTSTDDPGVLRPSPSPRARSTVSVTSGAPSQTGLEAPTPLFSDSLSQHTMTARDSFEPREWRDPQSRLMLQSRFLDISRWGQAACCGNLFHGRICVDSSSSEAISTSRRV